MEIADGIRRTVAQWRTVALAVGIGAAEITLMAPAFALAG